MATFLSGNGEIGTRGGVRYFDDWVPVMYRGSDREMIELAKSAGYDAIAVLENQRVTIFDYDGSKKVPLVNLPELFDELDPLYDPYLRALPKLFRGMDQGEEVKIGYIRSDDPPSQVSGKLEQREKLKSGGGTIIQVVGAKGEKRYLIFPFFLLLLLLRMPGNDKLKILVYLMLTLPVFLFSLSGFYGAAPALFLFPFFLRKLLDGIWSYHTERFLRGLPAEKEIARLKGLFIKYTLFFFTSLLVFAIFAGDWKSLPYLALTLINPYFAGLSAWAVGFLGRYTRQHRKFIPVALLSRRRWKLLSLSYVVLFCSSLLFLFFTLPGEEMEVAPTIPLPVDEARWILLTERDMAGSETGLPSGGDYLAHLAYHEGYLYGMEYRLPLSGEQITMDRYFTIGEELYSEKVIAKQFTEQWYADIMAAQSGGGIEALLINRGMPISLRYTAVHEDSDYNRTLPNRILLILCVLFLFVLAEAEPRSNVFTKVASIRMTRSKEQAA